MSSPVLVTTPEGQEIYLPRLTAEQVITLQETARRARRDRLIEDLRAAGVDPAEAVIEFSKNEDDGLAFIKESYTLAGAKRIVDAAISNRKPDEVYVDFDDLGLMHRADDLFALVTDLMDLRRLKEDEVPDPHMAVATGT